MKKCIKCLKEMRCIEFPDLDKLYKCDNNGHSYSFYFKDSLLEFSFNQVNEKGLSICSLDIYDWRITNQVIDYYFLKENSIKNKISLDDYIYNNISEKILNDTLTLDYVKSIINKLEDLVLFL